MMAMTLMASSPSRSRSTRPSSLAGKETMTLSLTMSTPMDPAPMMAMTLMEYNLLVTLGDSLFQFVSISWHFVNWYPTQDFWPAFQIPAFVLLFMHIQPNHSTSDFEHSMCQSKE